MSLLIRSVLIFAIAFGAFGQQAGDAIVVGSVRDSTQGIVAGAEVTLVHLATDSAVHVTSDERGQYRTPPLRIGDYEVAVEAQGFKRFVQRGVGLSLGDIRQIDAVLEIGEVSESVSVEATAPLLQTADSSVGTVITNKHIVDLPLNGRDYLQLAALSSGTVPSRSGVGISVGGQVGTSVSFLLDGVDNNSQTILPTHGNQKEVIKPSVDAIQEFKVVTNSYSAEYGRSSSGVVSVSLKSGSNEIHGSAYEFLRNEFFDARNFFAPANSSKPPLKRNQFGVAIGGPAIKNKTFWFADFEVGRYRESTPTVSTLPTLAQRAGQFTTPIYDPLTYDAATNTRQLFPGNVVPQSRFDRVSAQVIQWYPAPQNNSATNNFTYVGPKNSDPRRWDARVDQIVNDKQNLFFRYSKQFQDFGATPTLPAHPEVGLFSSATAQTVDSKGFALVHNRVWSPSLISSIRASWNYLLFSSFYAGDKNLSALVGLPGVDQSYPGLASMTITGYQSLGVSNVPNRSGSQTRQLAGDLTWNRGAHTVKFGSSVWWLQTNFFSSQQIKGIFAFDNRFTQNPATSTGGHAIADFLLGTANAGDVSGWAFLEGRTPYVHSFVQDDWRVSRRLTLNIGVRYEISPPQVDKQNRIANFDIDTNPASPRIVLAGSEGDSRAARGLIGMHWGNVAPRIGFAYSLPDDKTVIRGGYGLFYSNIVTTGGMQSLEINPPNQIRVSKSTDRRFPTLFLQNGFPADTVSLENATNVRAVSWDRSGERPLAQQWNLNIQRQLPGKVVLEAGYYGNKLDHLWREIDGNPAPPGPGDINARRRYPSTVIGDSLTPITLANVVRIQADGYVRYHALQVKAEKRYAKGLTFIGSYAWSKSIGIGDTTNQQNPLNWAGERAVTVQHVPHRFVASAVYELPFGRAKHFGNHWNRGINAVIGGWTVGTIGTLSAGMPIDLSVQGAPSNSGQADRPDVVGEWRIDNPTVQRWFNTAAFARNAPYTYGNAGRNVLRTPALRNIDLSAYKTFRITERFTAQFRLESFNATNTPYFGAPNTQVGNPNFGIISTASAPRNNQVGLKILF